MIWQPILLGVALLLILPVWADDYSRHILLELDGEKKLATVSSGKLRKVTDVRESEPNRRLTDCSNLPVRSGKPSKGFWVAVFCLQHSQGKPTETKFFCQVESPGAPLRFCGKTPFESNIQPGSSDLFTQKSSDTAKSIAGEKKLWGAFVMDGAEKKLAQISKRDWHYYLVYLGKPHQGFDLECTQLPGLKDLKDPENPPVPGPPDARKKGFGGCWTLVFCDDEFHVVYCRIIKTSSGGRSVRDCGHQPPANAGACVEGFKNAEEGYSETQNELLEADTSHGATEQSHCEEGNLMVLDSGRSEGTPMYKTTLMGSSERQVVALIQPLGAESPRVHPYVARQDGYLSARCAYLPPESAETPDFSFGCFVSVACWNDDGLLTELGCQLDKNSLILNQCRYGNIPGLEICDVEGLPGF